MICEVVGRSKKPYEIRDEMTGITKKGISCRVSVRVGPYDVDPANSVFGEGFQYVELRCPENIFDNISVGNTIHVDLDDRKTRIKSAMLQVDNGGFMPI